MVFVYYIPHTLKVELTDVLVAISLASLGYGSLLLHFISAATFALQFQSICQVKVYVRPQFVDTLLIVRLRPNMSMRHAVIINY